MKIQYLHNAYGWAPFLLSCATQYIEGHCFHIFSVFVFVSVIALQNLKVQYLHLGGLTGLHPCDTQNVVGLCPCICFSPSTYFYPSMSVQISSQLKIKGLQLCMGGVPHFFSVLRRMSLVICICLFIFSLQHTNII